jgi:hypothetical protein
MDRVGADFHLISSNFHPQSESLDYNTHKNYIQSTRNPQRRETIRKLA